MTGGSSDGKYTDQQKREIVSAIVKRRGEIRRGDNRRMSIVDVVDVIWKLPEKRGWLSRFKRWFGNDR